MSEETDKEARSRAISLSLLEENARRRDAHNRWIEHLSHVNHGNRIYVACFIVITVAVLTVCAFLIGFLRAAS